MFKAFPSQRAWFLKALLAVCFFAFGLPSRSASVLAAWALNKNGVLELRTSRGANLEAFYQGPVDGKGARVWIDFPGELIRPRSVSGSGLVHQIRLGKPTSGKTRLVVEFDPVVVLDPRKLKLLGTSPNRWNLDFVGLPTRGLRSIGEGSLTGKVANQYSSSRTPISASGLPNVPRGIYRVVIDPGHGGPDPGAVGIGSLRETDVVLDISLQVAKLLRAKGVMVNLTRLREEDLDLPPRVAMANRVNATAFVSIHANASRRKRGDINGVETFFFSGSRGMRLATKIQNQVLNVSKGSPNRGVRRGRFFVIRRTKMPAVLVETGFVTGKLDAPRLAKSSHRRKLALAIATGILQYLQELR
ncbi:N-acetylmuramoyl-L-alanine amidase [Prochlorococcus sp. MIT 1300]|uniref:N-acetylmuramoyl-L-alanine amidase n=1 Tax=Prochlorococcus sp. MIT 1300 TaxID=3096218 RepID=UPI002A754400|nr:N-acetylmuramoyl-L-alanine amidase [Prochlorococcus sp. MIT 1300]